MEKNEKMVFSTNQISPVVDGKFDLLVEKGTKLTKMAIDKYHRSSQFVPQTYSKFTENEYADLNKTTYECIVKYCAEKAGIENVNMSDKASMAFAWSNPNFRFWMFSIQTKVYQEVNSDNEVEQALAMANVVTVPLGGSYTVEPDSIALFKVQEKSYSDNVTRFQKQFRTGITIKPQPQIAGVSFDITQLTINYDFGKFMAKLAISFRAKMYQDIVDVIYTNANVSATVFYSGAFARATYLALAERLKGAAGADVQAYGTKIAFSAISAAITTGFQIQDESVRKAYINDIYGVPINIVDQAVNSNTASFTFRVPNDRFLLLAQRGDKPVKLVKEDYMYVSVEDGQFNPLQERIYKYNDSFKAQYATQCPYAIQVI